MFRKSLLISVFLLFSASFAHSEDTIARQAIIMDASTGTILLNKNADEVMTPSSMSKLMTLYITFDRLKKGTLKLEDELNVSEKAWRMGGSKSFVQVGTKVKVEDLLRGVIIQSGNDACVVLAEAISGSEEAFAQEMNRYAGLLGLEHSHFVNATGWPDEGHVMTARDLAWLAHHLIKDFPEYYHLFAEKEYTYNGITQHNRNLLLQRNIGVDGLKTGHTEKAGYGITVSAVQGDRRIILVVNGLSSESERVNEAERLVQYAFREFETKKLLTAGTVLDEAEVWMGSQKTVPITVNEDVLLTLPRHTNETAKLLLRYNAPLAAPVVAGSEVGEVVITLPGGEEKHIPAVAVSGVEPLKGMQRIVPAARYFLGAH